VPPSTTYAAAKILRDELTTALKKPVLLVTHNTTFMKAEKLKPKDAAQVVKEFEGAAEPLVKIVGGDDDAEDTDNAPEDEGRHRD